MAKPVQDIFFVSAQALLFVAYIWYPSFLALPGWPWLWLSGILLSIIGVAMVGKSMYDLNTNLSPFPSLKKSARLVTTGIYRNIRHPIYSGIIAFAVGYGLVTASGYRLLITAGLALLFFYKSRYEEQLLEKQYTDYRDYKRRSGAFFPRLNIRS